MVYYVSIVKLIIQIYFLVMINTQIIYEVNIMNNVAVIGLINNFNLLQISPSSNHNVKKICLTFYINILLISCNPSLKRTRKYEIQGK